MKTTIRFSAKFIEVTISGITIVINPNNMIEGLHTLKSFYNSVVPEERKASLLGSGIENAFNKLEQYEPFAKKALQCLTMEGIATAEVSFNEDGSISLSCSDLSASFNAQKFMQTVSDLSTFVDKEDKAEDLASEARRAEAGEDQDYASLASDRAEARQDWNNNLPETDDEWLQPLTETEAKYLDYFQRQEPGFANAMNRFNKIRHLLSDKAISTQLYADFLSKQAEESLAESNVIQIPEGIQRVDFHRLLKHEGLISKYPKPDNSNPGNWLRQSMTAQMIEDYVNENYLHGLIKVIPAEPTATDKPITHDFNKVRYNETPEFKAAQAESAKQYFADLEAEQASFKNDEAEERESKGTSFHNGESNYVGKPAPAKPSRTTAEFKALLERNKFKTNR